MGESSTDIYVVAMEASGDHIGAELIDALRMLKSDIQIAGIGGARMRASGVDSRVDVASLDIVGYVEILGAIPRLSRALSQALLDIRLRQPKLVVLIDAWGFSISLAKRIRRAFPNIQLVKYVGPQVWGSRPGRALKIAQNFDVLLAVSQLEAPFYENLPIDFHYVGYPALSRQRRGDRAGFRERYGIAHDAPLLALLPGSRRQEIQRLIGIFMQTAEGLLESLPDLHCVCLTPTSTHKILAKRFRNWPVPVTLISDGDDKADLLAASDVGLMCSGTITTEAALQLLPGIVTYRLDPLTYQLAKRFLFRGRYITMVNIAADRPIMRELIQGDCTPQIIIPHLRALLSSPALRQEQILAQIEALKRMGLDRSEPAHTLAANILVERLALQHHAEKWKPVFGRSDATKEEIEPIR